MNISTHILDTTLGQPVTGVEVKLFKFDKGTMVEIASGTTNTDGRHSFPCGAEPGQYQIRFHVESYLSKTSKDFFYTIIPVGFKIENTQRNYHVPLLLSAFSYSTYRGS